MTLTKGITVRERQRRLLTFFYNERLNDIAAGERNLVEELSLIDALRDCVEADEAAMEEWLIGEDGRISYY